MFGNTAKSVLAVAAVAAIILANVSAGSVQAASRPGVDLVVQKIGVGPDCRVVVLLARKGPSKVPLKVLGKSPLLRIRVGKKSYDFGLLKVDPTRKIVYGPGSVTFISPVVVKSRASISAIVDPLNKLQEAVERSNNILYLKKFPANCAKSTSGRLFMRNLKVARVYLKQKNVYLVLAKKPSFKIPKAEMKQVVISLRGGTVKKTWTLGEVIKLGRRGPKGEIHFNTNLRLKPGSTVGVSLKRSKYTKRRVFTLPAAVSTSTATVAGRLRRGFTIPPAAIASMAQRVRVNTAGGGVPKMISRGIMLSLPVGPHTWDPGQTFPLGIHVEAGHPPGTIELQVFKGRSTESFSLVPAGFAYTGEAFDYTVVVGIPVGSEGASNYYVMARLSDSVWGMSDMFTVTGPTDWGPAADASDHEIRVAAPNQAGIRWALGSTNIVSWRMLGEYRGENPRFEVSLERGGARVRSINSADAVWHANSRTYTLSWTIPTDVVPGNNYRIRVRDYEFGREDVSANNFTITRANDVIIRWPPAQGMTGVDDITVSMGNSYTITWYAVGNVRDRPLMINLRGPGYIKRLVDLERGGRMRWAWNFTYNCEGRNWVPPGEGYSIRLMTDRGDPFRMSTSVNFTVVAPVLRMLNPSAGTTLPRGERRAIRWSIQNGAENLRVRLVLMKGDESWMDIARNVLASTGGFIWTVGQESGVDLRHMNMGGPPPPPPGCDYSIKVVLENCHMVSAQSPQFCLD